MADLIAGAVFTVPYPYFREEVDLPPEDAQSGPITAITWRPGVRWVQRYDDSDAEAEGMGAMLLTVIDVHKPGRFPARVFFTRQWQDPDGKLFGKGGLRITTVPAFLRRAKGYMHEFELVTKEHS
ncbi:hypothetical protein [Hydrogenophaga laconesensis]|uniref:Uncharacterized protein n=1 Tax=Hydrogenophaga laconesensis TaxID=1805971 RepID=A0ABU1V4H9_9BURK|nr:hypothetical protein [Hydrogenophaga laconesensis]MDR7092287.1 hypothetical protein [Hydrogenophaga laconesensis]